MDPIATRFHACARFDRCSEVEENVTGCVVYVNPNDMGLAGWHAYQQRVLEEMSCGNFPSALVSLPRCHKPKHTKADGLRSDSVCVGILACQSSKHL